MNSIRSNIKNYYNENDIKGDLDFNNYRLRI